MSMNYYTFIPLCTLIINIFTWTYIYTQKRYTAVNRAYLAFAAFSALWVFDLFVLWSPVPDNLLCIWLCKVPLGSKFTAWKIFYSYCIEYLCCAYVIFALFTL